MFRVLGFRVYRGLGVRTVRAWEFSNLEFRV